MRKKRVTKLVALLLSAAMAFSLAACGGKESEKETDDKKQEESKDDEKDQDEQTGGEVRKLTAWAMDYMNASYPERGIENYHDWECGKLFDALLEEMNIELEYEIIPNEQFKDTVKSRLAAGLDLPDIMLARGSQSDWIGYGKSGMTWNIKELLDTYDEDGSIWKRMEEVAPTSFNTILDENGDLWWFPYLYRAETAGGSAFTISVRADWLENLDMEWKEFYTLEELYDVLVACYEQDANGNGVADEVLGFNPASEWEPISAAFGMGQKYIYALSDGSGIHCKLDHENFPAFIEYCQKLYQAGVFSTEILNSDNTILSGNRASAIYDYNAATYNELAIVGYEDTARYAPVILDDDNGENGYQIAGRDATDMCFDGWLINKDCEHPEAVVELMEYLYSEQGFIDMYWGIEGETFEYTDAGYPQFIDDSETLWRVITWNALPMAYEDVNDDEDFYYVKGSREGYPEKDEFLSLLVEAKKNDIAYCSQAQPLAMMTTEEAEEWNKVSETVNTYISELMLDLILGNKSLDDLATYRAEVGELGMDKMIEIREAQYDRYMND